MYALVIGRAFPDEKTGMMGIFEFEQAVALRRHGLKTVYAFCDTRSVKLLRTFNYTETVKEKVPAYGYHAPIGGLPKSLFERLKEKLFAKTLKKIIKDQDVPDIIHVHFPLLNLTDDIWKMLKKLNRPIVVTEHWSKVQTKQIESYRINLLKEIVHDSSCFMCVGEQLRKSVIELTGTNKDITVMPNMVNSNFYYKEKEYEDNSFRFVTVGRLVKNKRVDFLVEAFSRVFKDNKNVKLEIAGDGVMFNEIQKQIADLNMGDRITMHGFLSREKTANLLRESDAFVSASVLETFGVPFIEAMACGKPVIGIENGPIDSYINEGNGVLFKEDDLASFSLALNKIFISSKKIDGKGIANKAESLFSESAVTEQIFKQYNYSVF